MRLKNVLIVVSDIERAKKFYMEMFGLYIVLENEGNVILTEGLVLQEKSIWESTIGRSVLPKNNSSLLYFEERDIDGFVDKMNREYPSIEYVNSLKEDEFGQKMVRFYDLDGNLIEVRAI